MLRPSLPPAICSTTRMRRVLAGGDLRGGIRRLGLQRGKRVGEKRRHGPRQRAAEHGRAQKFAPGLKCDFVFHMIVRNDGSSQLDIPACSSPGGWRCGCPVIQLSAWHPENRARPAPVSRLSLACNSRFSSAATSVVLVAALLLGQNFVHVHAARCERSASWFIAISPPPPPASWPNVMPRNGGTRRPAPATRRRCSAPAECWS